METKIIPLSPINYHVFQWICLSEIVDIDALIDKAYDTAAGGKHSDFCDVAPHVAVQLQLSDLLDERLEEWLDTWVHKVNGGRYFSYEDAVLLADPDELHTNSDESLQPPLDDTELFVPIVCSAWAEVSSYEIAEAILRWKGKWHKLGPRPEVE